MNVPFHVGGIFMFYVCFPGGKANSRVSSFLSGTDCIPPMCVYIGTHPEIRKLILLQLQKQKGNMFVLKLPGSLGLSLYFLSKL